MVAGDLVVEHAEIETLAGLEEPGHPQAPVARELQQEVSAVAAMSEVPDVAGQVESIGAGHGPSTHHRGGYSRAQTPGHVKRPLSGAKLMI